MFDIGTINVWFCVYKEVLHEEIKNGGIRKWWIGCAFKNTLVSSRSSYRFKIVQAGKEYLSFWKSKLLFAIMTHLIFYSCFLCLSFFPICIPPKKQCWGLVCHMFKLSIWPLENLFLRHYLEIKQTDLNQKVFYTFLSRWAKRPY